MSLGSPFSFSFSHQPSQLTSTASKASFSSADYFLSNLSFLAGLQSSRLLWGQGSLEGGFQIPNLTWMSSEVFEFIPQPHAKELVAFQYIGSWPAYSCLCSHQTLRIRGDFLNQPKEQQHPHRNTSYGKTELLPKPFPRTFSSLHDVS